MESLFCIFAQIGFLSLVCFLCVFALCLEMPRLHSLIFIFFCCSFSLSIGVGPLHLGAVEGGQTQARRENFPVVTTYAWAECQPHCQGHSI